MTSVLIAIPTFESIYPDTFKALWEMDKCGTVAMFEFVRGYDCATARNNIVEMALERGADYLMMVDNDVTVPCNALRWMLEDGVDVVLGYYAHRDKKNGETDRTNVCKRGELNYSMQYTGQELAELREKGEHLVRVHGGGMGCMLARTDVFRRMPYPYYKWTDRGNGKMLSEDLYFCGQCNRLGAKVYVDTRVQCGHMLRYIQTV